MQELKTHSAIFYIFVCSLLALTGCGVDANQMHNLDQIEAEGVVNGVDVDYADPTHRRVLNLKATYETLDANNETALRTTQCTASAIGRRLILTAAHCIRATDVYKRIIYQTPTENYEYEVIRSIVPSEYPKNKNYDIAVLLLNNDLHPEIEILKLPSDGANIPSQLDIAGYGRNDGRVHAKVGGAGKLRKKSVSLHSNSFNENYFIVKQSDGGACQGDSGGPAMFTVKDEVVVYGVLARTRHLETLDDRCRDRADYIRVSDFLDFIFQASKDLMK